MHIVDGTAENPLQNYKIINNELKKYSQKLADLFQITAINKIDAIDEQTLEELKQEFRSEGVENIYTISAVTGENIEELKNELEHRVDTIPKPISDYVVEEDLEATNNDDSYWEVYKADKNTYVVDGGKIIRISQVINTRNTEQVIRLQNTMRAMGIIDELKRIGIQNGDTVVVGKIELEYWDDEMYKQEF